MSLLAFENVSKSYGATPALENVSLDIQLGKLLVSLGQNGSGKTTLIKLINGLLQPDQGRVLINDMDPSPATKAIVAYLAQGDQQFSSWDVKGNIFKGWGCSIRFGYIFKC